MTMADVTSTNNAAGLLRIYINGVLHLALQTDKLAEIQSWKMTTRDPPLFVIERTYDGGASQVSEYDDETIWKDVLAAVGAAFGTTRAA